MGKDRCSTFHMSALRTKPNTDSWAGVKQRRPIALKLTEGVDYSTYMEPPMFCRSDQFGQVISCVLENDEVPSISS